MKNVKLEIRKLSKAGFSLVEMLVVIAVIGIIAAIAIPNIGNVNKSARKAAAQRTAQACASICSAAVAAGYNFPTITPDAIIASLGDGTAKPDEGAFKGKVFSVPNMPATTSAEYKEVLEFLEANTATGTIDYEPAGALNTAYTSAWE